MPGPYPLEPSVEEMRSMGEAALGAYIDFVAGLDDAPSVDHDGATELAARFREQAPEFGSSFEKLLAQIMEGASKSVEYAGPGFFAYIPGGGLYASALAGLLAFGTNRYVTLWGLTPAFAQIETSVVRWLCDMFDFPPESRGVLTSGGSMANLSAIVTARTALLGESFLDGTLYTSEHAHHSVAKAAMIAGLPPRNVRTVPCTPDLRIDVAALHGMIDADRRTGLRPFCVVANAGTTNTGAIDPLAELVGVAHERRMWVHVDAAYGGFFQLTVRGRNSLRGIDGADSITLDPHKGMFLPYGTGALIVRDGRRLREAHHVDAHYLQDVAEGSEIPSFSDYSPELSRDFRGLRVWLPVKLHGLHAFRDALDEKLDLARYVYEELSSDERFEVPWEPELTVVPFRLREADDGANGALLERINASRRVFLSSTMIDGRFTLRVAILSHRSHRDRVEECVEIVKRAAGEVDR
jgi:aromatic-L-amino-acid decarboxylase